MSYSIKSYIGKEVRRISFLIKREKDYYNLFTLFEAILPDMPDVDAFGMENGLPFCRFDKKAPGDADKLFLSVDKCRLTEEMLSYPWDNMIIDGIQIKSDIEEFRWLSNDFEACPLIPLHDDSDSRHELIDMLPTRQCSSYVNYCKPQAYPHDGVLTGIAGNEKLLRQIKCISEQYLGFDLTLHSRYYGAFVFVSYNPFYRHIEFSEDTDATGIYCRVYYRPEIKVPLTFRIKAYNSEHQIIGHYERRNTNCCFLSHFSFDVKFQSLDIDVYDADNILIDYYTNIVFIHKISFDVNVAQKKVAYHDEDGKVRIVEKYSKANRGKIGHTEIKTLFGTSEEYSYDKFEKSLDFVFFDGDKEHQQENRQKAQDCVLRILNSARSICYIGDIFFNKSSFIDFITPIQQLDLEIRIISSKEKNNADELKELREVIENHNNQVGTSISCRIMKGKAALHDRFIIADDKMWTLGCSLNEFGIRATTLIRVPPAYANKLIDTVQQWWKNNELTEQL